MRNSAALVVDRLRDAWSVLRPVLAGLDGWDWVTVYATVVLLAGCWIAFGLGVALIVHGSLWLLLAVAGARGEELAERKPSGGG